MPPSHLTILISAWAKACQPYYTTFIPLIYISRYYLFTFLFSASNVAEKLDFISVSLESAFYPLNSVSHVFLLNPFFPSISERSTLHLFVGFLCILRWAINTIMPNSVRFKLVKYLYIIFKNIIYFTNHSTNLFQHWRHILYYRYHLEFL